MNRNIPIVRNIARRVKYIYIYIEVYYGENYSNGDIFREGGSIAISRSAIRSTSGDHNTEISSVQRMRHRVRGKSLSCPHFHVLSFLSFGMERADRKRGEIAFARYRFEMTRRTLCSPFDSLSGHAY